jgi:hypothetical protein
MGGQGNPYWVIETLLGIPATATYVKDLSDDELRRWLNQVNEGHIVTVGCELSNLLDGSEGGHALTVVGYDPGPPPTVTIRNPWGSNGTLKHGKDIGDGRIQISLDEFRLAFSSIFSSSGAL